ncbi:MAG: fumarylacetoacetase [Leptothrix sp. (in: Bacteria)]|nr:fumarylacetoacetase [Leptothrix sp. (in: b-proteobacteria)]
MQTPLLTDATHDPALRSWVESANRPGCDYPVQNLPLGRFRPAAAEGAATPPPRVGVAIGDQVLDLKLASAQCPWAEEVYPLLAPLAAGDLAAFMAMGRPAWKALRAALSAALAEGSDQGPFLELCLVPQAGLQMLLPCTVRDYSDFYIGIHHATAIGQLLRPDNPLLPNYKWLPIGYHGRASSIGLGGPVRRPRGQIRLGADSPPVYAPTRRLDYEMELGLWVGVGSEAGVPVPIDTAEDRLFGVTLLNDWSARDMQSWEYQPLGPFLSKSFATAVSPWVISFEALAPFRRPMQRPPGDPAPLDYLDSAANRTHGGVSITLEVWLQTARMRAERLPAVRLSQADMAEAAYWSPAQLVAHHTSNGCNLATGDLLGTGTLSGPRAGQGGSLMELSRGGREPLVLPGGEQRCFLEDGDTVALRAYCAAPGAVRIGLGALAGTVVGA